MWNASLVRRTIHAVATALLVAAVGKVCGGLLVFGMWVSAGRLSLTTALLNAESIIAGVPALSTPVLAAHLIGLGMAIVIVWLALELTEETRPVTYTDVSGE